MDFLKYIFSKCDFNLILKINNNKITMGLLNNIKDAILIIVSKKKCPMVHQILSSSLQNLESVKFSGGFCPPSAVLKQLQTIVFKPTKFGVRDLALIECAHFHFFFS